MSVDSGDQVLQHDVVDGLLEAQSGQPAPMHQRPGGAAVVPAMAQQEPRQLLPRLA
jgi:hypothetical protein